MNDNEVRRENQPQTGIVFLMSVLHAWLEYTDDQGFARRLKLEEDVNYLRKALVGAALEQEGSSYLIAQTAPNVSVLVNGRSVRKARLNNLDLVQVGTRRFIFHATYLPNTPQPHTAPGPLRIHTPPGKSTPLFPWDMVLLPRRFWKKALTQSAFSVKGTLLFGALALGALACFPRGSYALAGLLAGITAYMSGSVFFGFNGNLRFTLYVMPLALLAQSLFLRSQVLITKGDLVKNGYFLQGAAMAAAVGVFFAWQAKMAFSTGWIRCAIFGTTLALPWYSLMTGVFYFLL